MRIYRKSYLLLMLMGLFVVPSCVRDDIPDCPPLKVVISVKDKNYFNVDKVELEDRLDEDLPLRDYVPTLYWVLRDAATGEIVDESKLFRVTGDEQTYLADMRPSLQHGKYVLTVWGGLRDFDPLGDDPTTIDFHPDNMEGRDIYLTNDTLVFDAWHNDYTVELERTKGKLIIEKLNLPEDVTHSGGRLNGLFAGTDNEFNYFGETYVEKEFDVEVTPSVVTKTQLTPSLEKESSTLRLVFTAPSPIRTPLPVKITMQRNELTVVRYDWDPEKNDFDIYILINNNWELLSKMEID